MLYHAKNGTIPFPDSDMSYIRFGSGEKNLILLPGLGDGLRNVSGLALPTAILYRLYAKDYTVYMFSRKENLPQGYTTRDMAKDQMRAMDALGIRQADVIGVSMGGMIAQHLAADFPEAVNKLVLVVTAPKANPTMTAAVAEWMDQAQREDHAALMDSNMQKIYSSGYYRRNKNTIPVVARLTKPKSYDRFFVQADACLTHDAYESLNYIKAPTVVIGGEKDLSLGGDASKEIAAKIPGAELQMYAQWGHGLYEEAKDFNQVVLDFLRR